MRQRNNGIYVVLRLVFTSLGVRKEHIPSKRRFSLTGLQESNTLNGHRMHNN